MRRTKTALEPHNVIDAVVPEEDRQAGKQGRQGGKGDWQGQVEGRVGWQAGSGGGPGRVAGQVVGREWIFAVKNFPEQRELLSI